MATAPSKTAPKSAQKFGPQTEPEEEAPVKKSRKKLWILLLIVLLLVGGGAGGWYYWSSEDSDQPAPVKAVPPVFVALETFTVNLQPDPEAHFLQVGITLQVPGKEDVDLMKLHMPQVRSRLLLLLSSKKASDISTVEGKNKLAQEISEQVKLPFFPEGSPQAVTNVFFTSFVIQ